MQINSEQRNQLVKPSWTAQDQRAKLFVVGLLLCWVCAVLYAILMMGVR